EATVVCASATAAGMANEAIRRMKRATRNFRKDIMRYLNGRRKDLFCSPGRRLEERSFKMSPELELRVMFDDAHCHRPDANLAIRPQKTLWPKSRHRKPDECCG